MCPVRKSLTTYITTEYIKFDFGDFPTNLAKSRIFLLGNPDKHRSKAAVGSLGHKFK